MANVDYGESKPVDAGLYQSAQLQINGTIPPLNSYDRRARDRSVMRDSPVLGGMDTTKFDGRNIGAGAMQQSSMRIKDFDSRIFLQLQEDSMNQSTDHHGKARLIRFNYDAGHRSQYGTCWEDVVERGSYPYLDNLYWGADLLVRVQNCTVQILCDRHCYAGLLYSVPVPMPVMPAMAAKKQKAVPPTLTKAPAVELWWQKEKREHAEKVQVTVGLRNDVRSLLGM